MTLSYLPRPVLTVYLSLQIAFIFAVTMTTDMHTPDYWPHRNSVSDIPYKVFIHLISMGTIIRCFILLGKAHIPRSANRHPHSTTHDSNTPPSAASPCPYNRIMHHIGPVSYGVLMTGLWITVVALAFSIENAAAGGLAIVVLILQVFQAFSAVIEMPMTCMARDPALSACWPADRERGADGADVPVTLCKLYGRDHGAGSDVDADSDAHVRGIRLEESLRRLSDDDTVAGFEGEGEGEDAALLK